MSSSDKFKALISLSVIILLTVIISSCKTDTQIVGSTTSDSTTQTTQKSVISGQVINKLTGIPIDSALVVLSGSQITDNTITDSQGNILLPLRYLLAQVFISIQVNPVITKILLTLEYH